MGDQFPQSFGTIHPPSTVKPARSWRTWLFGTPLSSSAAPNETVGKLIGLAVFASDALSSTAYATQEILFVLAAAGSVAFGYAIPISIAIVVLISVVVVSYKQTIQAYPNGGGAYVVALENLGHIPAQIAAAALLTGYILTVSVSISSGVAQIVSAVPDLIEIRVELALVLVLLVTVINLRGVRESGIAFAVPAYLFLGTVFLLIGVGVFKAAQGTLGVVINPPELSASDSMFRTVLLFLLLHAFSSGTSALTGIEAIANGVTAFKAPSSHNASIVLTWMGVILAVLFLGITFLARSVNALPSEEETVVSQIARTVFGGEGLLYGLVISLTSVILVLAANTAFAGFPRLAAILAQDGYLPRQFSYLGSRLVFSKGIVGLGLLSGALIILFDASVSRLIPLYAIGVFLSFTFSQIGMARRWWQAGHLKPGQSKVSGHSSVLAYEKNYLVKLLINAFGALCTGMVTIVFGITNFVGGAWIVLVLIPILVMVFSAILRHYKNLARQLSLDDFHSLPVVSRYRVILPISGVHKGSLSGLRFARSLSADVTAVYISTDDEEARKIKNKWDIWGEGTRLVIVKSPYRLLLEPLLEYIKALYQYRQHDEVFVVVMPQFVSSHWWTSLLHSQTAFLLRLNLLSYQGIAIIEVPYQVE